MLVFGTQIHIVTFIFIVLETGMFIFQFFYYLFRPQDKKRLLYLILLFLMLLYNITGGLFPDPKLNLAVSLQMMIAYGSGFVTASYFPYYFYKGLELKALRWYALFGVPLFLILPYLIFFVVIYAINGDMAIVLKHGMIIPFIYFIILLWVIFSAIRKKHKNNRDRNSYLEEITMYCAVSPWASLAIFGFVEESQLLEVLCTNTGIVFISFLFIRKSIRRARVEYRQLKELSHQGFRAGIFEENCRLYHFTNREIQIIVLLRQGLTYYSIGEKLFISPKTVSNHVQHIYEKTGVNNKIALTHKLYQIVNLSFI